MESKVELTLFWGKGEEEEAEYHFLPFVLVIVVLLAVQSPAKLDF